MAHITRLVTRARASKARRRAVALLAAARWQSEHEMYCIRAVYNRSAVWVAFKMAASASCC